MNNIQGYKSFINDYKEKLKSSCIELIGLIKNEIKPKIEEILESHSENFKSYDVVLVDDKGDGIHSEYVDHLRFNSLGNWNIHIGVEFLGDPNRELMKEICNRIISEFPDDLDYSYCGGNEILLDIKD